MFCRQCRHDLVAPLDDDHATALEQLGQRQVDHLVDLIDAVDVGPPPPGLNLILDGAAEVAEFAVVDTAGAAGVEGGAPPVSSERPPAQSRGLV